MLSRRKFLLGAGVLGGTTMAAPSLSLAAANFGEEENYMFPRIFKTGKKSKVEIELADKSALSEELVLKMIASDGRLENGKDSHWGEYDDIAFEIKDGKIVFEILLKKEQKYTFVLRRKSAGNHANLAVFTAFALGEKLFKKVPLKGEYHLHTFKSDGKNSEREMLLECFSNGYDFAAISDHKVTDARAQNPDGSLSKWSKFGYDADLKKIIDSTPLAMKIYCAEEVHIDWGAHLHNFGGSGGVVEWYVTHKKQADTDIKNRAKKFDLGDGETNMKMAIADFVFDKVHSFGGIAVFNHPTWSPNHRHTLNDELLHALYQFDKCDAVEIVNSNTEDNIKAAALAFDASLKRGRRISGLGNSDAHNKKNVGSKYSIIFADENSIPAMSRAIKDALCVAVDNKKQLLVFGDYILTEYAYFLEETYYPSLLKIRNRQIPQLEDAFAGKPDIQALEKSLKQVEDFKAKFWQKTLS